MRASPIDVERFLSPVLRVRYSPCTVHTRYTKDRGPGSGTEQGSRGGGGGGDVDEEGTQGGEEGYIQGIHEYEIALEQPRVKGCCSYQLLPHGS